MEPLSRTEKEWGGMLAAEPGKDCLEAESLLALAERGRRAPNAERLYAHIAECPGCRQALKELKAIETMPLSAAKKPFRVLPWAVGLAGAAVLIFIAFQFADFGTANSSTPIAREKPAPVPTPAPNTVEVPRLSPSNPSQPEIGPTREPEYRKPETRRRRHRLPSRSRSAPVEAPALARPIETMDANVGWSREEISGEVLSPNAAMGEVISPNQVQGEVGTGRGG